MLSRTTNAVVGPGARLAVAGTAVLVSGAFGMPSALGQDADSVTVDVAHCVELESAAARRDCFGAQVDRVLEQRAATDPEPEPEPSRRAPSEQRAPALPQPEQAQPEQAQREEYFGTIAAIRERLPNAYVITLENGQVWQQAEPKRYPLRPGLEVSIYSTEWGDLYRLAGAGTGGHIKVRRIQ